MKRQKLCLVLFLMIAVLLLIACTDSNDASSIDGDSEAGDGDLTDGDEPDGDGDNADARYEVSPATMNGFGHETVVVTDTACGFPTEVTVAVQDIEAVLETISEDGCRLSFDPQGGVQGAAPIAVFDETGEILRLDEGFSFEAPIDPVFNSSWAIGDSMGAAMVSWYLSYAGQVKQGMFAQFFRQAGAYHPHPLTRAEGVPYIITLADLDAETGIIPTSALMTDEMVQFFLGTKPASELRLNMNTVAHNTSIPGLHDYTWPFRDIIYDSSEPTAMYERLLRFPDGIPEHPEPIMDVVEDGEPTFVIVSPGVGAYALDSFYISRETLSTDLDAFLNRLADMEFSPLVLLATMPDTSSLPARPFRYAERYANLMMNDGLYAAVDRVNARIGEERFAIAPIGELSFLWEEAQGALSVGGDSYPVETDISGRTRILLQDTAGATHRLGLGRFQGFFSLDHVHLTATGHALVANIYMESANAAWGPDGRHPLLLQTMPAIDPSEILDWDPETVTRLDDQASELGLPDLASYLDPLPPGLSVSEHCAISAGPLAASDTTGCPAEIQLLVDGVPCGDDPISLDASFSVAVVGADDGPLSGAAVGVSLIPAADHKLAVFLPGGLTSENGQYEWTLDVDTIADAPAGGRLFVQSGTATAFCYLP